jgi:hypothetical protein
MRLVTAILVGFVAVPASGCKKAEEAHERYREFMQESKVSEAGTNLDKIGFLAEEFYTQRSRRMARGGIGDDRMAPVASFPHAPPCVQVPGGEFRRNGQQVPRDLSSIQAKNYQPTQADWEKGEGGEYTAWYEMRWALTTPMRFGYCYEGVGEGMESKFTVWAFGDLDGDGVLSTYQRVGAVGPDGAPTVGPVVAVRDGE